MYNGNGGYGKISLSEVRRNVATMTALRNMCQVTLKDEMKTSVIRGRCGVKGNVVTRIEQKIRRRFRYGEELILIDSVYF